jgi:lysozyme
LNVNIPKLTASLQSHEALRLFAYDDATDASIKPGTTVKGHPTIGWGRALDVRGVTLAEANYLLANDIAAVVSEVSTALPWVASLDEVRARVLLEMAFQMGIAGLLEFHDTLRCVQTGQYSVAAAAMLDSEWAREQSPARAEVLTEMMRTGKD